MTQRIILFMAKISTVKIYKATSAKSKGTMEKTLKETRQKLARVLIQ